MVQKKESQHGNSRDGSVGFLLHRSCGVQILAHFCVYALVIDHQCVPRGQQLSAVFGGEEALGGRGSGKTPLRYGSNLELGMCFLNLSLFVFLICATVMFAM